MVDPFSKTLEQGTDRIQGAVSLSAWYAFDKPKSKKFRNFHAARLVDFKTIKSPVK
jgi:hypothetical protein